MSSRKPRFYLVNVVYCIVGNKLKIYFFSRDENYNYVLHDFPGISPYCYLTAKGAKLVKLDTKLSSFKIIPGFQSFDGSEFLYKIIARYPFEIGDLRQRLKEKYSYEKVYEGDIEYKLRYIIDKKIKTGYIIENNNPVPADFIIPLRICYLDIEVFSRKVARFFNPHAPVIVVGLFDSYLETYFIFTSRKLKLDIEKLKQVLKSEPRNIEIILGDSEKELFLNLSRKLLELNPDAYATFTKYDLRYLIRRMQKVGFNPKAFSRLPSKMPGVVSTPFHKRTRKRHGDVITPGISLLDLQFGYKIIAGKVVKWESLDAICKRELGYGKLPIESVYDTWLSRPEYVVAYNLRDVELNKELDRVKGISDYFISLKNLVGCPLEYTFFTTSRTDILYLRKCYGRYILPNRVLRYRYKKWSYPGAIVLKPVPGIHSFIAVLDFKSQYPNVMRTWNISFETIAPNGDLVIDESHRFKSRPKGIAVEIVEDFMKLRSKIQDKIKKAYQVKNYDLARRLKTREKATKTCMEGAYGQYGYKGDPEKGIKAFRLFNPDIASAIPIPPRELVQKTIDLCEGLDYQVIYGDTDSVFINLKSTDKQASILEAQKLKDELHAGLVKFIETRWSLKDSKVQIEIDKIFSRLIQFPVKKRYCGYYFYEKGEYLENEEEEWKGIEKVRADTPKVVENMLENLARMVLKERPKEDIINYLQTLYNDIINKKYSWLDLGIPTRMKKKTYKGNPIQKRTADYSNKYLETFISPGERFYRIWVKEVPVGYLYTDAIAYKRDTRIPDGFIIDYEKMARDLVVKKSKVILKLIGLSSGDIFPVRKKRKKKKLKGKKVTLDKFLFS